MPAPSRADVRAAPTLERVFRQESGRAVASLVRLFGDIDIAEEAVQEAFVDRAASSGPRPACRRTRPAGSSRPPATGPSTGCVARRRATTARRRRPLLHARDDETTEVGP